jgi:DNA polymerase-3 subunit gamma/tau
MSLFPDLADVEVERRSSAGLALARKYRPRTFAEMVGQDHVVRALTRALAERRLHHAYLFTGTRGVGKTTVSRILAKAVNCVGPTGSGEVTSEPCGVCAACRDIDAGRFVDYLEMDAASNRGVAEMTQVLEQAVYKPAHGRFKVYMIDEVHMLSTHAFNAMLKTLEEPPDYVKFVLATTDPQKVPVTVLSRCLQFNLRQLRPQEVERHLSTVLAAEGVAADAEVLSMLAQSAAGSMRDALSLADQAIAYCGTKLEAADVRQMLGIADSSELLALLDALIDADGPEVLRLIQRLAEGSLNLGHALDQLAALLHRLALLQIDKRATGDAGPIAARLVRMAERVAAEDLQLWYGIALRGRQDLAFAPDESIGFSMTILRMLSFGRTDHHGDKVDVERQHAGLGSPADPAKSGALQPSGERFEAVPAVSKAELNEVDSAGRDQRSPMGSPVAARERSSARTEGSSAEGSFCSPDDWLHLVRRLGVGGIARELAVQSQCIGVSDEGEAGVIVALRVPKASLLVADAQGKLAAAIAVAIGRDVRIDSQIGAVESSLAVENARMRSNAQSRAEAIVDGDDVGQLLAAQFGAKVIPGSVRPAD